MNKPLCITCTTLLAAFPLLNAHSQHHEGLKTDSSEVLTLPTALKLTLNRDPSIQLQLIRIEGMEGDLQTAASRPNPTLEAELENFLGTGAYNDLQGAEFTAGIGYTFERGDKRSKRTNVVEAEKAVFTQQLEHVTRKVLYRTRADYTATLIAQKRTALRMKELELAKQAESAVSQMVEAALAPEVERTRARFAVKQQAHALLLAQTAQSAAWTQLTSNWGRYDSPEQQVEDKIRLEDIPRFSSLLENLNQHPELRQFESLTTKAEADLELSKAESKADIDAFAGARYFNEESRDVALTFGVSIPWMIFNNNEGAILKNRSEIKSIQQEKAVLLRSFQNQLLQAHQNLTSALIEARSIQNHLLPEAEKTLFETEKGYENGLFTQLPVLEARKLLFELKENYLDALERYTGAQNDIWALTTEITQP